MAQLHYQTFYTMSVKGLTIEDNESNKSFVQIAW